MAWNEFEVLCGFGGGEETTRFGPRNESGSSLYQVDTVACVSSKNQVYLFKDKYIFGVYTLFAFTQENSFRK